jgi:hypothetical protein
MQPGYPGSGQDPYGQQQPSSDPYAQPQYPPPQYPPQYPQQPSYQDPYAQPQPPYADPYAQQPVSANPYPTSPAYPAAPQYPVAGYGAPPPPAQGNSNVLGLLGMIFGIVAIPMAVCCGLFSLIFSLPAGILGFLGIKKASEGQATNRGMALAGVICAGVSLVLAIIMVILGQAIRLNKLG